MEPEISTPVSSKKKFLIIALLVVLVAVAVALGYLFMQKDTPEPTQEQVPSTAIVPREVPHILSKEEKARIEERMVASSTLPISKKEKTAIGQKVQSTESFSALTEEEKSSLEAHILIQ